MSEQKRTREQRRKELKQKQTKKPMKLWLKRLLMAIVIVGVVGLVAGGSLFAYYASSAPELDEASLKDPISPKLLDANGEEFASVGAENREYIPYDEIPQLMEDAILATEDVRFYDHMGIDFLRLGKAVLANVTSGFGAQGASTLTQQVIKNSFLTNEKTLKRKAQEAVLAFKLERKYEKEEIFEMYFNKVLMSGRIYGYGTASKVFYGKELKDLSLDQIAVLAGMSQRPNAYNPFKNPDLAEKRRNTVLHLMNLHGKITDEEMKTAQAVPIGDNLLPEDQRVAKQDSKYDAFIDIVLDELEKNGDGDAISEGITIHTTLQPNVQQQVESTLNSDMFPTEDIQSGVAVIDTKTGAIAAVGGGRNYGSDRPYNYAQDMKTRSPGSTIKPLIDYAPAVEYLNWSTGQTIVDEKITYSGTEQVVRNFDGKYKGTMTMREALYNSRNVPAVKTLKEVGTKNAKEFINRFGIDLGDITESSAIGGTKKAMSPIQMAGAYAAFGNNGVHTEPYSITKIVYRDGKKEKNYRPEAKPVMKDSTAYIVTDVLRDVLTKGTGTRAAIDGLDVAGKSGTSNYDSNQMDKWNLPSSAFPDVWFAGYTTNYSIAIWSGYSDIKTPMTTNEERYLPQRIFKEVMSNISNDTERFKKPNSVVEATIEVGTNPLQLASDYTPNNLKSTELFVKGSEPTAVSEEYEVLELNAPSNLTVNYDEVTSSATLAWDYEKPEEFDGDVQFEVAVSIDNGPSEVLQTTKQKGLIVQSLIPGSTYVFSVTAVSDDVRSDSTSISLTLEGAGDEDLETNPDDQQDENGVEDSGNNENEDQNNSENNNGNGNGNNNSNNGNGNNGNNNGDNSGEEEPETNPEDYTNPGETSGSEANAGSNNTGDAGKQEKKDKEEKKDKKDKTSEPGTSGNTGTNPNP